MGSAGLMTAFNNFIEKLQLRELYCDGGKYTWTNKQEAPIMSCIDRVLVTTSWEERHPLCTLSTLPGIGSDHCPLLLNSGELENIEKRQFFFEKQWIQMEGFVTKVEDK